MSRFREVLSKMPDTLLLAFTTAVVTLILLIILSLVLGGENVRHREAQRCQAALIVNMLRDAYALNPVYEPLRDKFPQVNTDGLDCRPYLVEPFSEDGP